MMNKAIQILTTLLPLLRRSSAKDLKNFTELITGQFAFLIEQLEKALQEYCQLSGKIREMHQEMQELHNKLNEALKLQCRAKECDNRF